MDIMDTSDIAINATILVIKWAESSSETEAEEIRKIIAEICRTVIDKFKGDLCAEQTLARIKENPQSEIFQRRLKIILEEKMAEDLDFASKVEKLVLYAQNESAGMIFDHRGQIVHGSQTNIGYYGKVETVRKMPIGYADCSVEEIVINKVDGVPKKACEPSESRYLNTFFAKQGEYAGKPLDKPLIYGQKYILCVDVNPECKGPKEDPFPDRVLPWNGDSLPLMVVASSRDFEIERMVQCLDLPLEGASATLEFVARPKIKKGYGSLMIEVFYRGYLLQSKNVEALIIPTSESELTDCQQMVQKSRITFISLDRLDYGSLSNLPERLLTIEVERDPKDESIDFRFLDRTEGDKNLAFFDTSLSPGAIGKAISGIRKQLTLMVTGVNGVKGYEWIIQGNLDLMASWLPPLANAGRQFYIGLLPNQDQTDKLKATMKPGTVIQVNPIMGVVTIPWALLYDKEIKYIPGKTRVCSQFANCESDCAVCPQANDPYLVCPYAFWGYRYIIEQLPCWTSGSTHQPSSLILEIKNTRPLSMNLNVWNEFLLWRDHISKLQNSAQIQVHVAESVDDMAKVWENQGLSLDLVYFYCHGGVDDVLGLPYLQLSDHKIDSTFLEASHLNWQHKPLVFLNGCATGDYGPQSYVSLISDFRKGGACGVIGTECSVPELFAEAYAAAVLPKFFKGQPLGQAMFEISLDFLKKKMNPLGLVYTLYAYNHISLATPVA